MTKRTTSAADETNGVVDHSTLVAALIAAQQEIGTSVTKDREVRVSTKDRGSYSYRYATLGGALEDIMPVLHKHGLTIIQPIAMPDGKQPGVITRLLHNGSADSIESVTPIIYNAAGGAQAFGSGVSYARRYGLLSLLGLSQSDDDGAGADDLHSRGAVVNQPIQRDPPPRPVPVANGMEVANRELQSIRGSAPVPDVKERDQRGSSTDEQRKTMWGLAKGSLRMDDPAIRQEIFTNYWTYYGWTAATEVSTKDLSYKDMEDYIALLRTMVRQQGVAGNRR